MLKNLFVAAAVLVASSNAMALNDGKIKIFPLAATLEASVLREGTVAYADDTNAWYLRAGSSWTALATLAALANGATITNAVDGAVVITEGGEAGSWTVTNNLITFGSSTSATYAFTPAVGFTGDVTLSGGAGALTCGAAGCSLLATDNSAVGFILGSTGATGTLAIDSTDSAEGVVVTGYETVSGLFTGTGGVKTAKPLMLLDHVRFCGNGSNGGTPWFDGPVTFALQATDMTPGSAGCDGIDSATEATADVVYSAYRTMKVVGMECATEAGGAADTNTFQMRDDAADITGVTCAVTNDGATAKSCSVILSAPVTIVAGSALAIRNVQSGTDNMSAKDMECVAYFTY